MRNFIFLHHGDSLEYMKQLTKVDCIITDFPYYEFTAETKRIWHNEFLRLCGEKTIIVFGPQDDRWMEPFDQIVTWIKQPSTKNNRKKYSRFVEEALIYQGNSHVWNYSPKEIAWANYTGISYDIVDDVSRHPHRKPPALIERLIRLHTQKGDRIFDPFMGSGVVGEIAPRLGRSFIGSELSEKYFSETHKVLSEMYGEESVSVV